jgi:hypothetical protein
MRFSREYLLRPEDVCAVLGTKPKTLSNWRSERRGPPFVTIGRHAYYPMDPLMLWLDQQALKQMKGNKKDAHRK